ncbi:MAG TPA: OB-fold nucleic acid binding domain-containing protein, partial [Candidatus Nanoarchaeia archaeon]|nr:OB-fold nucleic acid binding domain-containing protein [Candidatus Nanoarchaeia archaeon]
MERIKIDQLKNNVGKKVLLKGFIHEIRDQSKVKFIILRDNSGLVQLVALPENKKIFEKIAKIPRESVISVEGTVKEQKQALPLGVEVHIEDYEILSEANISLPIPIVEKGESPALPTRLDWRWLDLRKPKNLL